MGPIHTLGVAALSREIGAGRLTSAQVTEVLIDRIERLNPRYNAFVTPTFELARAMARAADAEIAAGRRRGPLHGIPVALKDAYDTRGIRTAVGSRLYRERVPNADAEAWRRLQAAGAVLLGKLECTELCLGGPSPEGLFPPSVNPWDADRTPGGSSSGAGVALATGMVPAALGSDTGGSIRFPAALMGIAGFKPSYGLVSLRGLFPLSHSLDHAGPMARSARDCALLLDAIAGHDPVHPSSVAAPPPRATAALADRLDGLRIGHVRGFTEAEGVGADARASCEAALVVLADLGAEIVEQPMPDLWDFTVCNTTIMSSEAFAIHAAAFRARADEVTPLTRARIALGAFITAEDYLRAQKARRRLARATARAMDGLDALVYPGALGDAPRLGAVDPYYYLDVPLITAPANVAGVPAASVRSGLTTAGLPMAIQITGRLFDDAMVLRIAHAFEQATPDYDRIAGGA